MSQDLFLSVSLVVQKEIGLIYDIGLSPDTAVQLTHYG